jgi:hypothetical protein
MTEEEIVELFKEHRDEYLKTKRVAQEKQPYSRSEMNAFHLLDKYTLNKEACIISGVGHEIIYLATTLEELSQATEEDIIDLIRFGVMLNDGDLKMYV